MTIDRLSKTRTFFPFCSECNFIRFYSLLLVYGFKLLFRQPQNIDNIHPYLDKHTMGTGSNRQPAIEIDYNGAEKQLVFFNWQQKQLDTSKEDLMTAKKGLFGFDIFSDIEFK